jgi:hypothetical protein
MMTFMTCDSPETTRNRIAVCRMRPEKQFTDRRMSTPLPAHHSQPVIAGSSPQVTAARRGTKS